MTEFIVLCIIAFVVYASTRKPTSRKRTNGDSLREAIGSERRSEGHGKNFLPPIPKGFQIFNTRLYVAGIAHRRDDALRFASDSDQTLALERELGNAFDPNAIKVIGVSRGVRRFIGYVPKDVAEQIVVSGIVDIVQPRLERIWRGGDGYIEVIFQIIGPKAQKAKANAQYVEVMGNKPVDPSQKEFMKFFGLKVPKGMTTGQAAEIISQHREKLEAEDKNQLDEWDAYELIRDEFDDAEFRNMSSIKKVSDNLLNEAIASLKQEGETMQTLADDIDKVVEKLIELKPDLRKE